MPTPESAEPLVSVEDFEIAATQISARTDPLQDLHAVQKVCVDASLAIEVELIEHGVSREVSRRVHASMYLLGARIALGMLNAAIRHYAARSKAADQCCEARMDGRDDQSVAAAE